MEVLGHRGWPEHVENTLEAVSAALDAGADGVEVDVRLTADGVAVCVHDADLLRVAGVARGVRSLRLHELREVAPFVPRLDDLVEVVAGRGRLVLDLKPEQRAAWLVHASLGAVRAVGAVTLSSFDPKVVDVARTLAPHVARAAVLEVGADLGAAVDLARRDGHEAVHVPLRTAFADPDGVRLAKAEGVAVRVWTVNRPVDARLLELLDVDAVITDVPDLLLAARPVPV